MTIFTGNFRTRRLYLGLSGLITLLYWAIDSLVHYFVFDEVLEFIPQDANELWMRSSITVMLLALGYFADHHSFRIQEKEQEKLKLFQATVGASNHILNNYLQQMLLFKLEASNCRDFDPQLLELFDQIMDDTSAEVRKLEQLVDLNPASVEKAVYPQSS